MRFKLSLLSSHLHHEIISEIWLLRVLWGRTLRRLPMVCMMRCALCANWLLYGYKIKWAWMKQKKSFWTMLIRWTNSCPFLLLLKNVSFSMFSNLEFKYITAALWQTAQSNGWISYWLQQSSYNAQGFYYYWWKIIWSGSRAGNFSKLLSLIP